MSTQPPSDPQYPSGDPQYSGNAPQYGGAPQYGQQPAAPNPYGAGAAPTGPVPTEPPGPLATAVKLMYLGAALALIGLVAMFLMMDSIREAARESADATGGALTQSELDAIVALSVGVGIVAGLIGAGLWVLMAVMNRKGKGWARITATVLGVIGILFNIFGAFTGVTAFDTILSVVNLALAAAILFLLWRPENAPYYQARSA